VRADQQDRYLVTDPTGLYDNGKYASGGASDWDWNGPVFAPINKGDKATIWILDTGIQINHVEFARSDGTSRVVEVKNLITGEVNPPASGDCNGHGTHCAGSAAGNYRGIAINAELRGVRVLSCSGSGTWDDVIKGIQYISDNQVKGNTNILSASLGGGKILSVNAAIDAATANRVLCVVAAGNSNADCKDYSPASADKAITVGATDSSDNIATFSSWGALVNVFSPGVNIHSSYTGAANNVYSTLSGTSMATPLVAGSIALLATRGEPGDQPLIYDHVVQVIQSDSPKGKVGGLTGNKAASPNLFILDKWEKQ